MKIVVLLTLCLCVGFATLRQFYFVTDIQDDRDYLIESENFWTTTEFNRRMVETLNRE